MSAPGRPSLADRVTDRFAGPALDVALRELVKRGLRGVWVRGSLPPTAAVWAANHHSWWDGFVAGAVLAQQHRTASLLMDADNLDDYGFLRSIGVVSTQRPRQALESLREGRVLVVFPEAELRAPGPLGPLHPGADWFARCAPAALLPVALRVTNRAHQYPEAFVDIGPPVEAAAASSAPSSAPSSALSSALSTRLAELDATIRREDPQRPLPGFRAVVVGHDSWDERISRLTARWQR